MKHISDIELIEYVAGNLAESRAVEIQGHIADCPQCSQRVEQIQKLSDTLGAWEVETAGHDVAERVAALAQCEQHSAAHERVMKFMPQLLRVAASIVIAIGLGHKLGEYSIEGKKPQIASSTEKPEYVAALGLEWSSELTKLVLDDHPVEMEPKQ